MFSLTFNDRETYGRLFAYEKSYDRITTKTEKPLQLVDRIKYNTTTSDDPVIQQVRILLFSNYVIKADRTLRIARKQESGYCVYNRCHSERPHVRPTIGVSLGHCYPSGGQQSFL